MTPRRSNPYTRSVTPRRIIELSEKQEKAVSRVKSERSHSATLRSSRAFSIEIISLKQFLLSQSKQASESAPDGRYIRAFICGAY